MRQQDVHDELRARLHEAAGAHEPDRARILARMERGMAAPSRSGHRAGRPPASGWFRVAAATAAVAGVLAVGGYAVASAVKDEPPVRRTVAASPSATPTPSPDAPARPSAPARPTPGGHGTGPSRTPAPPPSRMPGATAPARPPAARAEQDGPLWSDGSVDAHSNDFWAQSNLTLRTTEPLTALTVRLKVAQTGGVTSTGAWRSLPEADFSQSVEERDGFLVYTWTLKAGRTVPAGRWVFAGQYDHARGGRDAKDDSYTMTGTADGHGHAVAGDFAPHRDGDGGS
ncbi:hypothetical protein D9753_27360 [Streptomyces dangxiongensis]|uniref:Uncharacterized protein n=1 Tax=Streptomyces dangxiongensis TaxID=1442032 RepID=A0A3G2JI05_9ACTN|nr:hypothetical protein [Streptomyces dangxiongensis]AYN41993.1 hypothetical protein D9753_27360 [Streptomyces dangxiongensis]